MFESKLRELFKGQESILEKVTVNIENTQKMFESHNSTLKSKLEQTEAKCHLQAKKLVEQEIKTQQSRNSKTMSLNRTVAPVMKRNSNSITKSNGNNSASNVSSRIGHAQTVNKS